MREHVPAKSFMPARAAQFVPLSIVLLALSCATVAVATAQDPGWLARNLRTHPTRYEGLLDQPNARREFNVLAFFAFTARPPDKLPRHEPAELRIQYCRPPAAAGDSPGRETAFIEVRQLIGHVNYLMKAAQAPVKERPGDRWQSFAWPSKDVIHPYNIDPNELGVVIHLGQDNEYSEDLVPSYFSADVAPPAAPIDHYELILRIQQNSLDGLFYEFAPPGGGPIRCFYQNNLNPCASAKPTPQAPIEAGSLVQLSLDLSHVPAGPVAVHIEGHYENSDADEKLVANFRFVHEPLCQ
jgi:hypothetical protein